MLPSLFSLSRAHAHSASTYPAHLASYLRSFQFESHEERDSREKIGSLLFSRTSNVLAKRLLEDANQREARSPKRDRKDDDGRDRSVLRRRRLSARGSGATGETARICEHANWHGRRMNAEGCPRCVRSRAERDAKREKEKKRKEKKKERKREKERPFHLQGVATIFAFSLPLSLRPCASRN